MDRRYLVVGYIREPEGTAFRRNSVQGSPFGGLPLDEASELARSSTVESFGEGYSSIGVIVNQKVIHKAPEVIFINNTEL